MKKVTTQGASIKNMVNIDKYIHTINKDNFQEDETHWRKISKNTITLFQVLIDQDLKDLVNILRQHPKYTQWVCEHFRYAYSYSENIANIDAASELLTLGEKHFSKQFVRNVVRKLPKLENVDFHELSQMGAFIESRYKSWHPIVSNYMCESFYKAVKSLCLHPLQEIVLMKHISKIERVETYIYDADDRDAVLDIPYMN